MKRALSVIAMLGLLACSKSGSGNDRPPAKAFDDAPIKDKCGMVASRFAKCADEWLEKHVAGANETVLDDQVEQEVLQELGKNRGVTTGQAAGMVCERGEPMARAVYDCWNKKPCDAFVTCVSAAASSPASP